MTSKDFPKDDFIYGVNYLFKKWEALQLTLEHETAGEATGDLIEDFKEKIIDWMLDEEVYPQDLEKYIEEVIVEDIGVEFEDGSITETATSLTKLWSGLNKNGKSPIVEMGKKEEAELSKIEKEKQERREKKLKDELETKSDDIIDEQEDDGWEQVKSKKKGTKNKFSSDKMDEE